MRCPKRHLAASMTTQLLLIRLKLVETPWLRLPAHPAAQGMAVVRHCIFDCVACCTRAHRNKASTILETPLSISLNCLHIHNILIHLTRVEASSKVDQPRIMFSVNEDIIRFHVSLNNSIAVQCTKIASATEAIHHSNAGGRLTGLRNPYRSRGSMFGRQS